MSVTIKSIDTIAEEDMYRRGGEYMTYTELWINPDTRECGASQQSGAPGQGIPAEEYHGLVLAFGIGGGREYGRHSEPSPDGDALEEFLESDEGQDLLDRICDGHNRRWDGNNTIGELDEDAEEAKAELLNAISRLPSESTVTWTVDDWFSQVSDREIGLRKLMSYRQIRKIADEARSSARSDNVYLDGDVYQYLVNRQKEMHN